MSALPHVIAPGATGPVLSGNMLFVNSGYGIYFHMPGNVLLAFGPKR